MTDYAELIEELERPVPKGGKCSHGYIRPLFSEREGIVRKKAATALETLLEERNEWQAWAADGFAINEEKARLTAENARLQEALDYQGRADKWLIACFGEEIARDKTERNHRFLEEALELVQAVGCTQSEAHQLVDYVFNRPEGEPWQEVGGVMNTLAALCIAHGLDMNECGERELARVWTKVEQIREKQKRKPKHSPLPGSLGEPND